MDDKLEQIKNFVKKAHGKQKRKYTNDSYFVHLEEVAHLLTEAFNEYESEELKLYYQVLGYMHDILEDTKTSEDEVFEILKRLDIPFKEDIVRSLKDLTKIKKENRAITNFTYNYKLKQSDNSVKSVKCADIISNIKDITEKDINFAIKYIPEKIIQLQYLTGAHDYLYRLACYYVTKAEFKIKEVNLQ